MENILGTRIHKKRIEKKITQEKFGEIVGVSKWTIINWESGKRIPLATYLPKISSALGASVNYLLGEEDGFTKPHTDDGVHKTAGGEYSFVPIVVRSFEDMERLYNGLLMKELYKMTQEDELIFLGKHILKSRIDDSQQPFAVIAEVSCAGWGIVRGSRVVVNPAERAESMDVALIRYHNKFAFKKIHPIPDGSVELIAEDGKTLNIPAEENDAAAFQIYGKAICALSNIIHGV